MVTSGTRLYSRVFCESCNLVQPRDFKFGDLCGSCGGAVRKEKRCHWCVKMTPDGKYCRHCGSGLLPDAQYGVGRWLKHIGTDQLSIPKHLAEMDEEQIEHFLRLYQKHDIVLQRHVEDLLFTEKYSHQRGWALSLEEQLLPLLPFKDEDLKVLTLPPLKGLDDREILLEIRQTSPFLLTQVLAAVARIRIWQRSDDDYVKMGVGKDMEFIIPQLKHDQQDLRLEVALTLCHWRFAVSRGVFGQTEIQDILYKAKSGPLGVYAVTHLALLKARGQGAGQEVPTEALASEDRELAFTAALANFTVDPLIAALREPRRRYCAALILTKARAEFNLAALLPEFLPDEVSDILFVLSYHQRPRPDLRKYFVDALKGFHQLGPQQLRSIRELLLLDLQPGDAVWLLQQQTDNRFISLILTSPSLIPIEIPDVCRELVGMGLFDPSRIPALGEIIKLNVLPYSFFFTSYLTAPDASLNGLRQLVTYQLESHVATADPGIYWIHTHLSYMVWNPDLKISLRNMALDVLLNWYSRSDRAQRPQLQLSEHAVKFYYPSSSEFLMALIYSLENRPKLLQLQQGYRFHRMLLDFYGVTIADLPKFDPVLATRLCGALGLYAESEENFSERQLALRALKFLMSSDVYAPVVREVFDKLLQGRHKEEIQSLLDEETPS